MEFTVQKQLHFAGSEKISILTVLDIRKSTKWSDFIKRAGQIPVQIHTGWLFLGSYQLKVD